MFIGKPECYVDFASRVTSKTYTHKTRKLFTDTRKDLLDLAMLDEQDAISAEDEEVVAAKSLFAALPTVNNDVWLDVNNDIDWKVEGDVG